MTASVVLSVATASAPNPKLLSGPTDTSQLPQETPFRILGAFSVLVAYACSDSLWRPRRQETRTLAEAKEPELLAELLDLLESHPTAPVVLWGGSETLPLLHQRALACPIAATGVTGEGATLQDVQRRHIDLKTAAYPDIPAAPDLETAAQMLNLPAPPHARGPAGAAHVGRMAQLQYLLWLRHQFTRQELLAPELRRSEAEFLSHFTHGAPANQPAPASGADI